MAKQQTRKQADSLNTSVKSKMAKLKALDKEQLKKVGTLEEQSRKIDSFKKYGNTEGGLAYIRKNAKTVDSIYNEKRKVLGLKPEKKTVVAKATNYTSMPKSPKTPSPIKKKK